MILQLFRRTPSDDTIARLYGAIVAQARSAAFYQLYRVPDTVNGRFEMVVLHAVLLIGRLEAEGANGRKLGQAVFDRFCSDMDGSLREMGVGDIAVPRKMKSIGEAFYGRKRAYAAALAVPGLEQLAQVLTRNVYESASGDEAIRLAAYVRDTAEALAAQDGTALRRGSAAFSDPLQRAPTPPFASLTGAP
jgi:cytochrome b pre-mRNA-processing protein 3